MKEQQKRKIQQFNPEIEDGTDLRRWPHGQHVATPKRINFQKSSKQPLTPPSLFIFEKSCCKFVQVSHSKSPV